MKRKLLLGLLMLVLVTLPLLTACGQQAPAPTTAPAPAPAPTIAPAPAPAPAPTSKPPEVIKLRYSCTASPPEEPRILAWSFMDWMEEKSGGRLSFERFDSASLGTSKEHATLIKENEVNVAIYGSMDVAHLMPLHVWPRFAICNDVRTVVGYLNKMESGTPEIKALMSEEYERALNTIVLTTTAGTEGGTMAKHDFNSLADLKDKKIAVFGADMIIAWTKMGCTAVETIPPDMYEALSRGVVEATSMVLSAAVAMGWYDVAKYYMRSNMYCGSGSLMVNLDTWRSLPPDIQQLFRDGAEYLRELSCSRAMDITTGYVKKLEAAGVTVKTLSPADQELMYSEFYKAAKADAFSKAEKAGKLTEQELVWSCIEKLYGAPK